MSITTACTKTQIRPDPEIIVETVIKYVEIPEEHLVERQPVAMPDDPPPYGEIMEIHRADRATIEVLNGQLKAIKVLNRDGVD